MQQQWEYKILLSNRFRETKEREDELNRLGAQGWELVAALPITFTSNSLKWTPLSRQEDGQF